MEWKYISCGKRTTVSSSCCCLFYLYGILLSKICLLYTLFTYCVITVIISTMYVVWGFLTFQKCRPNETFWGFKNDMSQINVSQTYYHLLIYFGVSVWQVTLRCSSCIPAGALTTATPEERQWWCRKPTAILTGLSGQEIIVISTLCILSPPQWIVREAAQTIG